MITYLGEQITLAPLATPVAPGLTRRGTPGTTTYGYKVVAVRLLGHTEASQEATMDTGRDPLSIGSYIDITPPFVLGALFFDIYRTTGGPTQGKIGTMASRNVGGQQLAIFHDFGRVATPGDPPATNTTGQLILGALAEHGLMMTDAEHVVRSLAPGAPGQVVGLVDGVPAWVSAGGGGGGASAFTGLSDTFSAYTGLGGNLLRVKTSVDGLESVSLASLLSDAAADGSTKGIAAFSATDFNAASGVISLDYTNGQAADATHKGFLASADWSTFNAKQSALGFTAENVANKATSTLLGTSNSLYPTQNAVKAYVDAQMVEIGAILTGATAGSVLYVGTGGVLTQDPTRLSYDGTSLTVGAGVTTVPDGTSTDLIASRLQATRTFTTPLTGINNEGIHAALSAHAVADFSAEATEFFQLVSGTVTTAYLPSSASFSPPDGVFGLWALATVEKVDIDAFGINAYAKKSTSGRALGVYAAPVAYGSGGSSLYGVYSTPTALADAPVAYGVYVTGGGYGATIVDFYGVYVSAVPGVTNSYGLYADDLGSAPTNPYYLWLDSQGVRRVREDHTFDSVGQAIEALYNPQFPKYTAGAKAYERVILGQWNGNVAELGNEQGPTQTLTSLTSVSTTATATLAAHGYRTGDSVTIAGATPSAYNGTYTVTVTSSSTFTYTFAGGTSPATGTITAQSGMLRALRLLGSQVDAGSSGAWKDIHAANFVMESSSLRTNSANGATGLLQAYDVDGAAYVTFATLTNANTPTFAIAPPSGGSVTVDANQFKVAGVNGVDASIVIPGVATITVAKGIITSVV